MKNASFVSSFKRQPYKKILIADVCVYHWWYTV